MSNDYDSIIKELDSNIPAEVISTRTQSGRSLSYLEAWYVRDRLNQVLGQGNWSYHLSSVEVVDKFKDAKDRPTVHVVARLILSARIGERVGTFEEVGYGNGMDKAGYGPAHELAYKEAASDALKRAAANLGRSMGLALYDKSQEYVDAAPTKSPQRAPAPRAAQAPAHKYKDLIVRSAKALIARDPENKARMQKILKDRFGVGRSEELSEPNAASFAEALHQMLQNQGGQ